MNTQQQIINLIKREVVPAMGCTEPIAVALCVARAKEVLGEVPQKINIFLSANVLKNAMGVGIPATGMVGLPIAVALGALIGKSEDGLELLKDITPEAVEAAREYMASDVISISLKPEAVEKLYIEVEAYGGENRALAVISTSHTNFSLVKFNDEVLHESAKSVAVEESDDEDVKLTLRMVYDFAMTTPVEELEFVLESGMLNFRAAEIALRSEYGHCVGKTIVAPISQQVMGDNILTNILSYTAAACDARMAGAALPVMSNSGSGNQGIAATVPVVVYCDRIGASMEQRARALALSNLVVIYAKQSLGRLSALCGCVVAATGSSCALTYLMDGDYAQIVAAVKNMIANLTGLICDGAKPSCSMKLCSGVSTAVLSAMMAISGRCVSAQEGIIDEDVDKSIRNLTDIGRDAMTQTDSMVLDIMTHKC